MKNTEGKREEIPESFSSYEEAGEFWDRHDSTEYLDRMTPVDVEVHLQERRFEIEVDEDIMAALEKRARTEEIPVSRLANNLLRKHLLAE